MYIVNLPPLLMETRWNIEIGMNSDECWFASLNGGFRDRDYPYKNKIVAGFGNSKAEALNDLERKLAELQNPVSLEECDLCHDQYPLAEITFTGQQTLCKKCNQSAPSKGEERTV